MQMIRDDGGRSEAGFAGRCGDCSTRAIAIGTGLPYDVVWNDLTKLKNDFRCRHTTADKGMPLDVSIDYLENYIGSRIVICDFTYGMYLQSRHLPYISGRTYNTKTIDEVVGTKGTYILLLNGHMVCVKDGVIHDTWDSRGKRAKKVYGYWKIEY